MLMLRSEFGGSAEFEYRSNICGLRIAWNAVENTAMQPVRRATIQEIDALLNGVGVADLVVAQVPADIKDRLSAKSDDVLLSRYTAGKQSRHPEITAQSFSWLQSMLEWRAAL